MLIALPAVVALVAWGDSATAATVSVVPDPTYPRQIAVLYAAAPGERNDVVIVFESQTATVTDTTSPIIASSPCVSVAVHTATCDAPRDFFRAVVGLGDLDDTLRVWGYDADGLYDDAPRSIPILAAREQRPTASRATIGGTAAPVALNSTRREAATVTADEVIPDYGVDIPDYTQDTPGSGFFGMFTRVTADGGPGDDRLYGDIGDDELHGGGGRDELHGRRGVDILIDGDRDGASGEAAPGSDAFHGDSEDVVWYGHRRKGVAVDLGHPDQAPGEGDRVHGIGRAVGGAGNDRLAGTPGRNHLIGGPGRDRLLGRGGDDTFELARGDDLDCGRGGSDTAAAVPARGSSGAAARLGFVDRSCELVTFNRRLTSMLGFAGTYSVTAPAPTGRSVSSVTHWINLGHKARGTITWRQAGTGRLLAQASIPAADGAHAIPVWLTAIGRVLVSRPHGVLARACTEATKVPDVCWTARFEVPSTAPPATRTR